MEHPARIGKYEIEAFLGGGMSHVYRAKDGILGRTVALKILTELATSDGDAKARFLQEARIASNISHENVIAVYDFGEENGRPFMVMEYLEGESLRDAMKAGHVGDFRRKVKIALQLARAIECIHSKKIVHRDVKPENVHVDPDGRVTLMDFGIAKTDGAALTRSGTTLGTPYYMAPEQVMGQPATAQTDIYAYGVVLYELMTGVKPVHGDHLEQVFHQILYSPVPMEPLDDAKVPPLVVDMIARCLAKAPAQRPQNLAAICGQLETLLAASWSTPFPDTATAPRQEPTPPPVREAAPEPARPQPAPLPPSAAHREPAPPRRTAPPPAPRPAAPRPAAHREEPARRPQTAPSLEEAYADDLPSWLQGLPAPLRTEGGLIVIGAAGVAAMGAVVLLALKLARVI